MKEADEKLSVKKITFTLANVDCKDLIVMDLFDQVVKEFNVDEKEFKRILKWFIAYGDL